MSCTSVPPRVRRPGFLDHLVPPAIESAHRDEDAARLWGVQLPLGILLYVVAQALGGATGALVGVVLGETTKDAIAGAAGRRITLFPTGLLIGSSAGGRSASCPARAGSASSAPAWGGGPLSWPRSSPSSP